MVFQNNHLSRNNNISQLLDFLQQTLVKINKCRNLHLNIQNQMHTTKSYYCHKNLYIISYARGLRKSKKQYLESKRTSYFFIFFL